MSTIPFQQAPHFPNGQAAHSSVPPNTPTPEQREASKRLKELSTRLTESNINKILRDPDAKGTREILDKIRPLLSHANLRMMLQGPNAEANAKILRALGAQLSHERLSPCHESAMNEAAKSLMNKFQLAFLESIAKAFEGDGFEDVAHHCNHSRDGLVTLKRKLGEVQRTTEALSHLGSLLTKARLDQSYPAVTAPAKRAAASPAAG